MTNRFVFCFACLTFITGCASQPDLFHAQTGLAKVVICKPASWNGNVLIFAHGLRMPTSPLIADVPTDSPLSKDGWMLAATSYRRNGYVVDDAIDDVEALRELIIARYGQPKAIYLQGDSMGGAIVTKLAEAEPNHYAGVLAIGAALGFEVNHYTFAPRTPLLFMSNRDELGDPKSYAAKAAGAAIPPVLWTIDRDGHCNVSEPEETAAVRALVAWHDGGAIARDRDGTIATTEPASVATVANHAVSAGVIHISSEYGNILTQFVKSDLAGLDIVARSTFSARCRGRVVHVLLGKSFYDVKTGEWVAFFDANGHLLIAQNFANAAKDWPCDATDTITISQ